MSPRDNKLFKLHWHDAYKLLFGLEEATGVSHNKVETCLSVVMYLYICIFLAPFFHSRLVLAILNFAKRSHCKLLIVAGMFAAGMSLDRYNAVPDKTYMIAATCSAALANLLF